MDKVYLQKLLYSGTTVSKGAVKETGADFSVYPSEVPFIAIGDTKDVAKRDWYDEDGLDVFYDSAPKLKDYDLEITCLAKAETVDGLRKNVNSFISYLSGGDGKGNVFALYDTHCGAGRRNVRFVSFSEDSYYNIDEIDNLKLLSFKIKMHVDDPRTEVTLGKAKDVSGNELINELLYNS